MIIPTKEDCVECGACCFFGKPSAGTWGEIIVGEDGWCIHYDPEKKCTIHDDKPQVCIEFETGCDECVFVFKERNNSK